ncbi:hypothetical protein PR048_026050 [Dryococelus australis]|uniref:Uncharacterized protein n=1 Tax=Dryococelus australis TaxID=614101 RepID=A0ABQ9GK92_9NEOP|nr:hypothetical protein PR048_026050 [Dryococelus australis]
MAAHMAAGIPARAPGLVEACTRTKYGCRYRVIPALGCTVVTGSCCVHGERTASTSLPRNTSPHDTSCFPMTDICIAMVIQISHVQNKWHLSDNFGKFKYSFPMRCKCGLAAPLETAILLPSKIVAIEICWDKIDVQHVYAEVTFAIGSQIIRHALDDSDTIADLQGNNTDREGAGGLWVRGRGHSTVGCHDGPAERLVSCVRAQRRLVSRADSWETRSLACSGGGGETGGGRKDTRRGAVLVGGSGLVRPDANRYVGYNPGLRPPRLLMLTNAVRLDCSPHTKADRVQSPGWVTPGFSHVGIMLDDAAGRRGFLGDLLLPRPLLIALRELSLEFLKALPLDHKDMGSSVRITVQQWNARAGETGYHRGNPPTSGIASSGTIPICENPEVTRLGDWNQFALVGGEQSNYSVTYSVTTETLHALCVEAMTRWEVRVSVARIAPTPLDLRRGGSIPLFMFALRYAHTMYECRGLGELGMRSVVGTDVPEDAWKCSRVSRCVFLHVNRDIETLADKTNCSRAPVCEKENPERERERESEREREIDRERARVKRFGQLLTARS